MAYSMEIERRFIVDGRTDKPWRDGFDSNHIRQYYIPYDKFTVLEGDLLFGELKLAELTDEESEIISTRESFTSRIRITQHKSILTLKGKRNHTSAIELEWEIEPSLAENITVSGDFSHVEKVRFFWPGEDGLVWEVDEFEGGLAGLILAEVELENETQEVVLPEWLGMELTGLHNWSNAALAQTLAKK
jgi:CYTH domain-containing protein